MNDLPKTILLASDGSKDAALAARVAADLSQRTGAGLHVAHVWYVPAGAWPSVPDTYSSQYETNAERVLAEQVEAIQELGGEVAGSHLSSRSAVAEEILYLAGEIGVDLVVIGSRGAGRLKRLATGSVSEGVVHHAHLPVLMMRGGEDTWPPGHVVVGEDGSEASRKAGGLAAGIARLCGAGMTVTRAYPELPEVYEEGRKMDPRMTDDELHRAEKELGRRAGELGEELLRQPRISIAVGDAAENLVKTAEAKGGRNTLIAVGSRGMGPVKRFRLGSVSTKVLRAAEGPVLVYPADAP